MTIQELMNILSFLFVSVGTILGWRIVTAEGRNKKLEGDQTITTSRKIEAETMETIISSAGQAVETYKQILDRIEISLNKCEQEKEALSKEMTDLRIEGRAKDLQIESLRQERQRLFDKIIQMEEAAKEKQGERQNGT